MFETYHGSRDIDPEVSLNRPIALAYAITGLAVAASFIAIIGSTTSLFGAGREPAQETVISAPLVPSVIAPAADLPAAALPAADLASDHEGDDEGRDDDSDERDERDDD